MNFKKIVLITILLLSILLVSISFATASTVEEVDNTQNQYLINTSMNTETTPNSTIVSSDLVKIYKNDSQFYALFLDNDGNPLKNENVYFTITGKTYAKTTNNEGIATQNINLEEGFYKIISVNPITGENKENNITVLSKIQTSDLTKTYKNNSQFNAKILDNSGKVVSNKNIEFTIVGKTYTKTTNNEGIATLNINLAPGTYQITTKDPETQQTKTNTITVVYPSLYTNDLTKIYKNNSQFNAKLQDNNGKGTPNKNIEFTIVGKTYTKTTNNEGIATLNINLAPGTYQITTKDPETQQTKTNTVKVIFPLYTDDLVKTYKNNSQFNAKLLDENGNPQKDKNIEFTIVGKTYTKTTNNEGIATLNINLAPGTYQITTSTNIAAVKHINTITVLPPVITNDLTKIYKNNSQFNALYIDGSGAPIINKEIKFTIVGKTYTKTTNNEGIATLNINLAPGTYQITTSTVEGGSVTNNIKVLPNLEGNDAVIDHNPLSTYNVHIIGNNEDNLPITINVLGKDYVRYTVNGTAKLNIRLSPGDYIISAKYDGCSITNTVKVRNGLNLTDNNLTTTTTGDKTFNIYATSNNQPVSNAKVIINIGEDTYSQNTNSKGIASKNINLGAGQYLVDYYVDDGVNYGKGNGSILINGTKFSYEPLKVERGQTGLFKLYLTDMNDTPRANVEVNLTYNDKNYTKITDENGMVSLPLGMQREDIYDIQITFKEFNGEIYSDTCPVLIGELLTYQDLLYAATWLKLYIGDYRTLPDSVHISSIDLTLPEFTYLMAYAISNNWTYGDKFTAFYDIQSPTNPLDTPALGYINDYIALATTFVNYVNNHENTCPNLLSSNLGEVGYDNLVYAFSRILCHNDYYGVKPDSVYINSLTGDVWTINTKNTITNLAPYRSSNQPQVIKELALKITEGLTTDLEKATAIFDYVRNNIRYSEYYNTRYGAVGTLEKGVGNCCDQAHLTVALYRSCGLATRYVHGFCVFSSGSRYGHVWSQVLVGDTWMVSDTISYINSLGVVENWNPSTYDLSGRYINLPF